MAAQVLTQPLRRLADTAEQVHDGDFDLERLPESGPREIAATTRAFNDMALTLKAVEARPSPLPPRISPIRSWRFHCLDAPATRSR